MLKRITNRKAQNTAEYAILIALVIGAVIAMQTYMQRAMNGRVLDTSKFMTVATSSVTGNDYQYEPYYQDSDMTTSRNSTDDESHRGVGINQIGDTTSSKSGYDAATFDRTSFGANVDYGNAI